MMAWQYVSGSFESARILGSVAYDLYYILFVLLLLQLNKLAQMVRLLVFDAHVLGSIPCVCILFSQYF